MIYRTLQRNPKIDHRKPHYTTDVNSGVSEVAPGIKQEWRSFKNSSVYVCLYVICCTMICLFQKYMKK